MRHHTTDPATRAKHIAEREAYEACQEAGSYSPFYPVAAATYKQAYAELTVPEEV